MNTPVRASIAARVLCLLLIVIGIATAPRHVPRALGVAALIVLALLFALRPSPRPLLKRAISALLAIAAIALPIALSDPDRAAVLGLRASCAALAALAIASTIPSDRFGPALSALGMPRTLAASIAGMLRQVSAIGGEGRRLVLARRLRGATGLAASTDLFAALVARSALRAERVELALRLRGYDDAARPEGVRLRLADVPIVAGAALLALSVHAAAWL